MPQVFKTFSQVKGMWKPLGIVFVGILILFLLDAGHLRRLVTQALGGNQPLVRSSITTSAHPSPKADESSDEEDPASRLEVERLSAIMNDANATLGARVAAAAKLLEIGSDEDADAAIHLLGQLGGPEAISLLTSLGNDTAWPAELRQDAIEALGNIGTDEAKDLLLSMIGTISNSTLRAQAITSLGHNPSDEAVQVLMKILNSHSAPAEVRSAAAEGLAQTTTDALPVLKDLVSADPDPDVRANAAWAISTIGTGQSLGPELAVMAKKEEEPNVRRRIYEALLAQSENPSESLLPTIKSETDPSAQVAGFNALGDAVGRGAVSPNVATTFDSEVVPELTQIALSDNQTVNLRTRAVFALRRAGTDAALIALNQISQTQTPMVARAAYNGLH